MRFITQIITIQMKEGEPASVAAQVCGYFAYHVHQGDVFTRLQDVTHVPTGYALAMMMRQPEAKHFIRAAMNTPGVDWSRKDVAYLQSLEHQPILAHLKALLRSR